MPTYEYRCAACAHTFEEYQSMTAEPFEICPHCGKPALKRVIGGGAGMIFKGSGFYLTDYKKGTSEASTKSPPKGSPGDKPSPSEPSSPSKEDSSKSKPTT